MRSFRNVKRKLKLNRELCSFSQNWDMILKFAQNHQFDGIVDDLYFENVPIQQGILAEPKMISQVTIDYSHYTEVPVHNINKNSLYECFHGILFYIYFYSGNKFNNNELEIHFSGARNFLFMKGFKKFNILNIFDYENVDTKIEIECLANSFFGITFKRIRIQPTCYSIRSSNCSCLVSFTFEGYDEENQKWDVLDERNNINDLISGSGFALFYVRSTKKYYSSFKIKQTGVNSNDFWGFSLSAFDIHGVVFYREDIKEINDNLIIEERNNDSFLDYYDINPSIDMSECII